jgi:hypothetical protein
MICPCKDKIRDNKIITEIERRNVLRESIETTEQSSIYHIVEYEGTLRDCLHLITDVDNIVSIEKLRDNRYIVKILRI